MNDFDESPINVFGYFVTDFCLSVPQKPKSRHEELKERARLLLEQARREAAAKKGTPTSNGAPEPIRSPSQPVAAAAASAKPLSEVRNTI